MFVSPKKKTEITNMAMLVQWNLPWSSVLFSLRKHFHQTISTTSNITSSPAITIPTTAHTDMLLLPISGDGGSTKSAKWWYSLDVIMHYLI